MSLRQLPSVDRLLQEKEASKLIDDFGRTLATEALRDALEAARTQIQQGAAAPPTDELLLQSRRTVEAWFSPSLVPVVNATGVIIHTNLGRAPLSAAARQAVFDISGGYSTLEYDLGEGQRGKREHHVEAMLTRLTGAPAALVVNNNASAVLLALTVLAKDHEVLISRSQLIEIGGGFRIPDVLAVSGADLKEVGTTNRTHLKDFRSAISPHTALIFRAHHSNFKIVGFTTEPSLEELVELGHEHEIPVVDDLGSGTLLDTTRFGLGYEPMVQDSLRDGAGVVTFSGDKLLGGPQAGILLGESELMERLKRHPLARAVRPDKMSLAALAATLSHYLRGEALEQIPVWQMIAAAEAELKVRAEHWQKTLDEGEVVASQSTVGGGSLPEETLPTRVLALRVPHPDRFAAALRSADPAVIARIEDQRLLLDPRTVLPHQDDQLLNTLSRLLLDDSD